MGVDPIDDVFSNIERLRLPLTRIDRQPNAVQGGRNPFPSRVRGEFLKGPIPLSWLSTAASLSGKAPLAVALALWFESGRRKSKEVLLTTAILARFDVERKAKYRGLRALEKAGLVSVRRHPHRNPVVTILETHPAQVEEDAAAAASRPICRP